MVYGCGKLHVEGCGMLQQGENEYEADTKTGGDGRDGGWKGVRIGREVLTGAV